MYFQHESLPAYVSACASNEDFTSPKREKTDLVDEVESGVCAQ